MSDKPWNPEVERIRKAMMERFSDKLSMEEIAEFAYSFAVECRAPAPQPEIRNLLIRALVEICYMHSAEVLEQVKSAEGESILEEGMKLLGLKDLSEEEVARVRAAAPQVTPESAPELELEQEADGRWLAEFLRFAGVMAYGKSPEEAIRNAAKVLIESEQASPTPELGTCQDHHATITPSTPHARTPYCCEWHSSPGTTKGTK